MVATSIVDMGLHVCKVKALVVATSYQGLQLMDAERCILSHLLQGDPARPSSKLASAWRLH